MSDRDEEITEVVDAPWQGKGLSEDNTGATAGYVSLDSGEEEKSLDELKAELEEGEEEEGFEGTLEEAPEEGAPEAPEVLDPKAEEDNWARELAASLRRDPEGTVAALARYYNVHGAVEGTKSEETPSATSDEVPKLKEGEEFYDYMGRVQESLLERTSKSLRGIVREELGAARNETIEARAAQEAGKRVVDEVIGFLDKNYPDWVQYDSEMQELVRHDQGLSRYPAELYRQGKALAERRGKLRAERGSRGAVRTGERTTKPATAAPKEARNIREAFEQVKRDLRIK